MASTSSLPPDPAEILRTIWGGERRPLTVGLLMIVAASAFEALAVATVMPAVVRDLGGLDLYGQAFSAYLLASLVGIAVAGTAADSRGPTVPMIAGTAVFVAGLAVSGAAGSMPTVVAGRALQGLGSGAISAVSYAAIARAYPVEARPRMLALLSSAWVVPGLVGPAIAGFVAEHVGWRPVFLAVAPLLALGSGLSLGPLARLSAGADDGRSPVRSLSLEGEQAVRDAEEAQVPGSAGSEPRESAVHRILRPLALASGAGIFLHAVGSPGRFLSWLGAFAGIALALGALRRLLPEGTLQLRAGTPAAVALVGSVGFAFFGAEAFLPLALSEVRGRAASYVGIPLTAGTLCWTVGSWIQAREAHHRSRSALAASGVALIATGIVLVASILAPSVPIAFATAGWAIAGLGMGIAYSTTALVVLEAPGAEAGKTSAALQLAWALGIALGTGLGGTLVATTVAGGGTTAAGIARVDAMTLAALLVAGLAATRLPRVAADASRRARPSSVSSISP